MASGAASASTAGAASGTPAKPADKTPVTATVRLELLQLRFLLKAKADVCADKSVPLKQSLAIIEELKMAPYLKFLSADTGIALDEALFARLSELNAAALVDLDAAIESAKTNAGPVEIRDAMYAKAAHYTSIGDRENAIKELQATLEKTVGVGPRLDVHFDLIRVGMLFWDNAFIKDNIGKARKLIDDGGDWDRRNRLKVYEATYLLSLREFKKASDLFIETLATFTSTELMSIQQFVQYAVWSSVVSQDRVTLKNMVIDSPEILEVIDAVPPARRLIESLYECNYAEFFVHLAATEQQLKHDVILHPHYKRYAREMRIRAYSQMLESYKSVTLVSMANMFGVTVEFLDTELSRFVAARRLECVVDAVSGVVERNHADQRNAQYVATIKQGDALLNRVQKLSRVMNL